MKPTFTIWVFGIITNKNNEILLVHRTDYDLWNLPWWWLEKWESPWDGVIREIREETWLHVKVEKLLWIYNKTKKAEVVFNFLCKVTKGTLTLNDEARDIQYFNIHNIPKNTVPKQVERIYDYFNDKDQVTMKIQDWTPTMQLAKEWKL